VSLRNALLGLLHAAPMNGYAIKTLFDESIAFIWQAELSQIYRELGLLERELLVTSSIEPQSDRPNKRVYSITDSGRAAFRSWLLSVPDVLAMPKRDELMLRLFFGSMAGEDVVREELTRFLSQIRRMNAAVAAPPNIAERYPNNPLMARADRVCREDRYCGFLRKRALMTSEALIQWAESCLEELSSKAAPTEDGTASSREKES